VIKFGIKSNEKPFTAKEVAFPNGIYSDIHELIEAINTTYKNAKSHFYFGHHKERLVTKS